MTKSYQWYYDGAAISGATGKTHTLTSGQTDSNLIECRTEVTYGTDSVAALAEYAAAASTWTENFTRADETLETSADWTLGTNAGALSVLSNECRITDPTVTSGGSCDMANAVATASADGSIAMDIRFDTGASYAALFMHFRFTDANNYQRLVLDNGGSWTLEKRVSGGFTTLDSGSLGGISNSLYRALLIEFSGSLITVTYNGSALTTNASTGGETTDSETTKRFELASTGGAGDIVRVDNIVVST